MALNNLPRDLIGRRVSHFRIIEELGAGAMGVVFKAEDIRLARTVALKFYRGDSCCTEEAQHRVLEEAQLAASIHHPNICTIYDVDEFEGIPFIAMSYVQGTTVSKLVQKRPLPVARALGIAIQVAKGLEAAHRRGVAHRDVKSENIMLRDDGHVILMDFGVAISFDAPKNAPSVMVGTAAYLSPEQASGSNRVDHRTDVWSLGVCLYEMLTSRLPFQGDYVESVIYAILSEEPTPLEKISPDIPPAVRQVVARALTKDPGRRYLSMTDFIVDLEQAAGAEAAEPEKDKATRLIAVLPFVDLSADKDNEYFCDGITEEIINDLTRIPGLRVAARTSSFAFKDKGMDIREIGEELGVDYILEGSVRKSGERVRITGQLIDVSTGYHMWSSQFDRKLKDVFAIQEQIARGIADLLKVSMIGSERQLAEPRTTNVEAYDAYLHGCAMFYRSPRKNIDAACGMFKRAIELDPGFARPYARLADCYSYLQMYFERDRRNLHLADMTSRIAVQLDPESAQARASRGLALSLDGRYDEAEHEFETAILLNPKLFEAYYFFARTSFAQGKLEKAVEMYKKASEVNPDDYQSPSLLSFTYRELGKIEESRVAARESIDAIQRHIHLYPEDARAWYLGASSLLDLDQPDQAREWAEQAMTIAPEDPYNTYGGACFFSRVGDVERALHFFEAAIRNGFAHKDWIDHDGDLETIRSDPRFKKLVDSLSDDAS